MLQEMEGEHCMIGRFMAVTMESAVFMAKNYQTTVIPLHIAQISLKQIFDISTRLVSEQDEISGLEAFGWENHSWKYLSSIGNERIINLQRTKIYVFSDSVLCLGKIQQKNGSKSMGAKIWMDQIFSKLQRLWRNQWRADWIRVDHFPGFTTLQLYGKVTDLLSSLGETETFTRRILFMSMFNDISCDKKDHGEECLANAKVVSIFANKLGIRQWSFVGPSSEKKWFSVVENSPQRIWDIIEEKILVEFADSGCPIFRVTTPLSSVISKAKGTENCRFTLLQTKKQLRLFFAKLFLQISSIFTEQSQKRVKNVNPFTLDQRNLIWWWDNQLFSVKSRQKFRWRMTIQRK